MKIAVTYDNKEISHNFEHTSQFKVYDVAVDGKIIITSIENTTASGDSALSEFLKTLNVTMLICNGIDAGAKAALDKVGIELFAGCSGNADIAVDKLLAGTLDYTDKANCEHRRDDEEHKGGPKRPENYIDESHKFSCGNC